MDWLDVLRKAVAEHGSVAAVSRMLCGSGSLRPALSLALNGKYFGDAVRLEKLVLGCFARVECPWLGESIPIAECRATASASAPTHNPAKLKHWRACRACPHKPKTEESCKPQ